MSEYSQTIPLAAGSTPPPMVGRLNSQQVAIRGVLIDASDSTVDVLVYDGTSPMGTPRRVPAGYLTAWPRSGTSAIFIVFSGVASASGSVYIHLGSEPMIATSQLVKNVTVIGLPPITIAPGQTLTSVGSIGALPPVVVGSGTLTSLGGITNPVDVSGSNVNVSAAAPIPISAPAPIDVMVTTDVIIQPYPTGASIVVADFGGTMPAPGAFGAWLQAININLVLTQKFYMTGFSLMGMNRQKQVRWNLLVADTSLAQVLFEFCGDVDEQFTVPIVLTNHNVTSGPFVIGCYYVDPPVGAMNVVGNVSGYFL